MLKQYAFVLLTLITIVSYADDSNLRYQYTHLVVHNAAPYPVQLELTYADGSWKKSFPVNVPFVIASNATYENTLISHRHNNSWKNFSSLYISQIGNARENYLIAAENASSQSQFLDQSIRDGLGGLFVGSMTNHCVSTTTEGYSECVLTVQSA